MHHIGGHDELLCRVDKRPVNLFQHLAGHWVKAPNALDPVPVKVNAVGLFHIRGVNFNGVSPSAETPPLQNIVVALVLQFHETAHQRVYVNGFTLREG